MAAAHENLNIPPHDPDATLPQDAYKFEKICPPTLWDVLPYKKYIEAATNDEKERALQEDKVAKYTFEGLSLSLSTQGAYLPYESLFQRHSTCNCHSSYYPWVLIWIAIPDEEIRKVESCK